MKMKTIKIFLFFTGILLSLLPLKAHAFLDIFVTYGTRNNQIEGAVCKTLEATGGEWERVRVPIQEEYGAWSLFRPKVDSKSMSFQLDEYHYDRHPSLRSL